MSVLYCENCQRHIDTDEDVDHFDQGGMCTQPQSMAESLALAAYGMTKAQAHAQGICIKCKQVPDLSDDANRREYMISGICGSCFDAMWEDA